MRPASETWNHTFSTNVACLTSASSVVERRHQAAPGLLLGDAVEQAHDLQPVVVEERLELLTLGAGQGGFAAVVVGHDGAAYAVLSPRPSGRCPRRRGRR